MVRHDVAGTVRQEQIVQYIQRINPVHTTNGGRDSLPLKKVLGHFAPMAPIPLCIQHTIQLHTSV